MRLSRPIWNLKSWLPRIAFIGFGLALFAQQAGVLAPSGDLLRPAGRQIPLDSLPLSTALSPDGKYLLVLHCGANTPSIRVIDAASERELQRVDVPDAWLGIAFAPNGRFVYVSGGSTGNVYEFAFSPQGEMTLSRTLDAREAGPGREPDFIGDVAVTPDGRLIYAAALYRNGIVVINPQSGRVIDRVGTERRPYRILFHPDGQTYYVSSWAGAAISQHETLSGRLISTLRVGSHPTDIVWRDKPTRAGPGENMDWTARMFIPAANTNDVYVAGVAESKEIRVLENVNLSLYAKQPLGMTPSAAALSPDQDRLYVVCSDANAIAVLDVSSSASQLVGYIPTGYYPTALRVLPDGRLFVANGQGTGSFIDPYSLEDLLEGARIVRGNMAYKEEKLTRFHDQVSGPIPGSPDATSPIEHVIYILKAGGPLDALAENAAPNHHKLAAEFVHFNNFFAVGTSDLDGMSWNTAAIVPDFMAKLGPASLAGRARLDEGEPAALPPAGYLWSQARQAGLDVRAYGLRKEAPRAGPYRDASLLEILNAEYPGPDPSVPDIERARVFARDVDEFDKRQSMPRLLILRLGNDAATADSAKGSPRGSVADNDYALGLIVDRLSHSRFWPKMAIFVAGAYADDYRTAAFMISPYARRGAHDNKFQNSLSMLRTIELILGLRPMTHFDAGATPMTSAFQIEPDPTPYVAEKPSALPPTANP